MAQPAGKRSTMILYANSNDPFSHRVRLVLAEKGISAEIIEVSTAKISEELLQHNPYGTVPTLIDRELRLYSAKIITEYLDERFPHPPLLPVYPVARAKSRQMIYRIERDWYSILQQIETLVQNKDLEAIREAKKQLENSLNCLAPVFIGKPFFLSEEFTLVDCCVAPLLWRLRCLEIKLDLKQAIKDYENSLFKRPSFKETVNQIDR